MKKSSRKIKFTNKKVVLGIIFLALLLPGIYFVGQRIFYYKVIADQASIYTVRELLLSAVLNSKKDAPIEPRTGDIYFPESKLYLPHPDFPNSLTSFTYRFDAGVNTDSQAELSVSTNPIPGAAELYNASNVKDLFAKVPKFQACSRGIKIVYSKYSSDDSDNSYQYAIRLNNGHDAYVYVEKSCPELIDTAAIFKNLKAY